MTAKTNTKAASTKATKAASTKPTKAELTALELAARDRAVTALVTEYHKADKGQTSADAQAEEVLSTVERLKNQAKDGRVRMARTAYLLATHKDIAGRKASNMLAASKALVTKPGMDAKEIDKAARSFNPTFRFAFQAGEALAAKGYVFYTADPTESERAIVEKSYDETLRTKSTKGNAKTKAKQTEKPETDGDGIEKSKAETVIPTVEGITAALETVLSNVAKFKADGGFSEKQAETIQEILMAIGAEVTPVEK